METIRILKPKCLIDFSIDNYASLNSKDIHQNERYVLSSLELRLFKFLKGNTRIHILKMKSHNIDLTITMRLPVVPRRNRKC